MSRRRRRLYSVSAHTDRDIPRVGVIALALRQLLQSPAVPNYRNRREGEMKLSGWTRLWILAGLASVVWWAVGVWRLIQTRPPPAKPSDQSIPTIREVDWAAWNQDFWIVALLPFVLFGVLGLCWFVVTRYGNRS